MLDGVGYTHAWSGDFSLGEDGALGKYARECLQVHTAVKTECSVRNSWGYEVLSAISSKVVMEVEAARARV